MFFENIYYAVLQIKLCNFGTPKELLAIALDPPEVKDIDSAILNLKLMGALLPTVKGSVVHLVKLGPDPDLILDNLFSI